MHPFGEAAIDHKIGAVGVARRRAGEENDGLGDFFRVQELYKERYVVIFPPDHRLSAVDAIRLSDLSDEPYVDRLSCEMRDMVMDVCRQTNVNLYARFRSEREDWVQSMVLLPVSGSCLRRRRAMSSLSAQICPSMLTVW